MFVADGMTESEIESLLSSTANADSKDLINAIEKSMDKRNSLNQQTMIELQSATSKRDQSYDMIANISKSLNQVEIGIVNNI
jgi:replication-associated recombination protein RarA